MAEKYLSEKDVAKMTGLSLSTLQKWRHTCKGIPYIKLQRAVRYRLEDVIAWMDSHIVRVDDDLVDSL